MHPSPKAAADSVKEIGMVERCFAKSIMKDIMQISQMTSSPMHSKVFAAS